MEISAIVCREKSKLAIEKLQLCEPRQGQILVKILACGVCHTDSAALEQLIPVNLPIVLGHEGVGIVEKVGPGVKGCKEGDKVILAFPSCGHCHNCIDGKPYACDDTDKLFFSGVYDDNMSAISEADGGSVGSFFGQGAFANYAIADERNAVVVTEDVDIRALCSMGCGVNTGAGAVLNRLKPEPGSSVAVFGCGGVGMAAIMAAKLAGCSHVIAVDIVPERLQLALELGATDIVNSKECDASQRIREICGGRGANGSIECTGNPNVIRTALTCLAKMGTCVLCSVTGPVEVPIALEPMLMNPSVTLAGLVEGGSNPRTFIPELVKYYAEGRLPIDKLVKFYNYKDFEQAFHDAHSGAVIKPILVFED